MTFDPRTGLSISEQSPPYYRREGVFTNSSSNVNKIIDTPRDGRYVRNIIQWKVPMVGWISMPINPQSLRINEKKDLSETRTKAGFVLQYAGESLTEINIDGTTGSAGVEGINILRTVYRAEQIAFDKIAKELERTGPAAEILQIARGISNILPTDTNLGLAQRAVDLALNIFNQPFPTLASLASNIEMYYQGLLYRGYFRNFGVTENVTNLGHFDYSMSFIAHSRQGIRRNFMPWHRQPYNPIGMSSNDANPYSFNDPRGIDSFRTGLTEEATQNIRDLSRDQLGRQRNTNSSFGGSGIDLTDESSVQQ